MQTRQRRKRFYVITVVVLIAILGSAIFIVEYFDNSYVKIVVTGTSHSSFVISYDSTSVTLSASENATVEVLPHANLTITAIPATSYAVAHWDVNGANVTQRSQDTINFLTAQGGTTIHVSAELVVSASG